AREPRVPRRRVRAVACRYAHAGRRTARPVPLRGPPAATGRHAEWRAEAAAGPGRRGDPQARAAVPGRADQRGRPRVATRLLGKTLRTGRRRHHAAGVHPLHGRGRALPPHRHPRWRRAGGRRCPGRTRGRAARAQRRGARGPPAPRAAAAVEPARRAERGADRQQPARAVSPGPRQRPGRLRSVARSLAASRGPAVGCQPRGRVRRRHAWSRPRRGRTMKWWRRLWAVVLKELRQIRRDRISMLLIVAIPVIDLLMFGYAINFNPRNLDAMIIDQANTATSRAAVMDMRATGIIEITGVGDSPAQAMEQLRRGRLSVAIVLPPDYDRRLAEGRPAVQVMVDGTDTVVQAAAVQLAQLPLEAVNGRRARAPPAQIEVVSFYNPERRSAVSIVPGL